MFVHEKYCMRWYTWNLFSGLRPDVPAVSLPTPCVTSASLMEGWCGAERALTLCKHCSAVLKTSSCYHCFAHRMPPSTAPSGLLTGKFQPYKTEYNVIPNNTVFTSLICWKFTVTHLWFELVNTFTARFPEKFCMTSKLTSHLSINVALSVKANYEYSFNPVLFFCPHCPLNWMGDKF